MTLQYLFFFSFPERLDTYLSPRLLNGATVWYVNQSKGEDCRHVAIETDVPDVWKIFQTKVREGLFEKKK